MTRLDNGESPPGDKPSTPTSTTRPIHLHGSTANVTATAATDPPLDRSSVESSPVGSWVAAAVAALGLAGVALYFIVGTAYQGFYGYFGLSPDEVGITRGLLIDRTGPLAAAYVGAATVVVVCFVIAPERRRGSRPTEASVPGEGQPAGGTTVVIVAMTVTGCVLGLMLGSLTAMALMAALGIPLGLVARRRDLVRAERTLALLAATALPLVAVYVSIGEWGREHAGRVVDGGRARTVWSAALDATIDFPYEAVTVVPIDGSSSDMYRNTRLLGDHGGQLVFYDTKLRRVLRVPAGTVVVVGRPIR